VRLKQFLIGACSAIVIASLSSVAFAGTVTSKEEIAVSTTGGGIKIKSDNGNSFQFGGRIMYDMDFYDGLYNSDFTDDNFGDDSSEAEFRRTRLEAKGSSGKNWTYELAVDVDEGETRIQTGFITYKGLSFADVHLGRFKVPFGLEELGSSKWTTSIERSPSPELGFLFNIPSFSLGLTGHTNSLFWGASIIDEDNEDEAGKDAYSLAGRLGGHFSIGENSFMHLAASYATRDFGDEGNQRFRTRLGVHTTERVTINDAERFGVDDANQFGLEAASVFGPLSLQGEYREASYDEGDDEALTPGLNAAGQRISDVDIDSYYLQASYLLTGESRVYKSEKGIFDKVKPKGPRGAWELVAKYEEGEVDVDILGDKAEFELLTLGVNWYANNNLKFMLNYLDTDTDGFSSASGDALNGSTNVNVDDEDGSAISLRAQYVF